MIDKQDYYHGAAILQLLRSVHAQNIKPHVDGYAVNDWAFIVIKYSTRNHSPWRFTLTPDEAQALSAPPKRRFRTFVALVCGGDGICVVNWDEIKSLLPEAPAWISCRRLPNKWYSLAGALGELQRKIPLSAWPALVFDRSGLEK